MKKLSEPARQFAKIYIEEINPENKQKRKILINRQKRKENIEKDLGI